MRCYECCGDKIEDALAAFILVYPRQRFIPQPAVESSSLPFGQSLSPSQSQCLGTQAWEPWQLNISAAQVMEPETQRKFPLRSLYALWERSLINISKIRKQKNAAGKQDLIIKYYSPLNTIYTHITLQLCFLFDCKYSILSLYRK